MYSVSTQSFIIKDVYIFCQYLHYIYKYKCTQHPIKKIKTPYKYLHLFHTYKTSKGVLDERWALVHGPLTGAAKYI